MKTARNVCDPNNLAINLNPTVIYSGTIISVYN